MYMPPWGRRRLAPMRDNREPGETGKRTTSHRRLHNPAAREARIRSAAGSPLAHPARPHPGQLGTQVTIVARRRLLVAMQPTAQRPQCARSEGVRQRGEQPASLHSVLGGSCACLHACHCGDLRRIGTRKQGYAGRTSTMFQYDAVCNGMDELMDGHVRRRRTCRWLARHLVGCLA